LILSLKLNPDDVNPMPPQGRDVRAIGHYGTGDFELTIRNMEDFEDTKHLIYEAFRNIGG
jgi:predicted transport protein